jgi:hypothetical protein
MREASRMNKRKKTREKGVVLVIALIVGLAMLIMAIPFLFRHSNQFRNTEKSNRELLAFNMAEAGVERALWEENLEFLLEEGGIEWVIDAEGNSTGTIANFTAADNTVVGDIDLILTAPAGTEPDTRILEATGKSPFIASRTVNRTVRLTLEKFFKSIFDFGFFVDEYFYIRTNYWIDSYNSSEGPYGGDNMEGDMGCFGMNSASTDPPSFWIDQGASSNIYGMVAAGPDTIYLDGYPDNPDDIMGDVIDVPTEGSFVGDAGRMVLSESFEMPSVNVYDLPPRDMFGEQFDLGEWFFPEHIPAEGEDPSPVAGIDYYPYDQPSTWDINPEYLHENPISIAMGDSDTLTSFDNGVYRSLNMERNSELHIQGNVAIYITGLADEAETQGSFYIGGGDIILEDNASLTLILGNTTFLLENNTNFNQDGIPADLLILGTDQFLSAEPYNITMGLENNGEIHAAIYVPRVTVQGLQGNTNLDIFGAMISYSMDFKTNVNFHYDEALGELDWVKGGLPYWKIIAWQQPFNPLVVEE